MFAGSGALGLEAASRGASRVVSIELDRRGAAAIRATVQKLSAADVVEVVQADALAWLARSDERFDVIFIDPPFAAGLHAQALAAARARLRPGGLVYWESDCEAGEALLAAQGWGVVRAGRAGAVFYRLLESVEPRENGDQGVRPSS